MRGRGRPDGVEKMFENLCRSRWKENRKKEGAFGLMGGVGVSYALGPNNVVIYFI